MIAERPVVPQYDPAVQSVGDPALGGQNEPVGHGPVTAERPVVLQNDPAVQSVCDPAFGGQNEPFGQKVGVSDADP